MRQKTVTERYRAVCEGKMAEREFVRQMRQEYPMHITQFNGFKDSVQILKNRGLLFEEKKISVNPKYDERPKRDYPLDALERGIRYELEASGIDSVDKFNITADQFTKAEQKAKKNLEKDPVHYINLISGESSKVDKHDKEVEIKRGEGKVDVFNGLKNATLKEGYTEEQINAAIQRLKEKKNLANEASQEESVADYIIKHYTNPKTGKSLVDDEIVSDFFKTHPEWEQQADGSDDGMKDLLHNFGEYLDANYEGPSDMREGEVVKSHPDEIEDATFPVAEAFKKVGIDMSKDVHVHYTDGGAPGLGAGRLKDKGLQSAESVLKMLEAKRLKEIEQYEEDKKDAEYEMEYPVMYEYFYYGGEKFIPEGKEFKLTFSKFEGESYDIFQEASNMGEEEKRELPKSIADKERDQIEKDAKKAKGMIKEKLTEVEAIQVGIDKGYSNEQIAAAISKLKGNQVTTEEKKIIDLYDDGDVVVDISRATPEQERLINYEFEISEFGDSEEAQEVADELMNLNSADDVENYYANERGWDQDPDMRSSIRAAVDIFRGLDEKKGKDHDKDGDIDSDDYMAAKDKAIKKAMGKEEQLKEAIKGIIRRTLEEGVLSEAATNQLAGIADQYEGFEGMKQTILALQNIVTEIESFYDKTRGKIQKIYDSIGEVRNEEGLKVGPYLAPAIEAAFRKDLNPVTKAGFTKGLEVPKVRVISQKDIDAHNSGEAPLGESEPKQTMFTPKI